MECKFYVDARKANSDKRAYIFLIVFLVIIYIILLLLGAPRGFKIAVAVIFGFSVVTAVLSKLFSSDHAIIGLLESGYLIKYGIRKIYVPWEYISEIRKGEKYENFPIWGQDQKIAIEINLIKDEPHLYYLNYNNALYLEMKKIYEVAIDNNVKADQQYMKYLLKINKAKSDKNIKIADKNIIAMRPLKLYLYNIVTLILVMLEAAIILNQNISYSMIGIAINVATLVVSVIIQWNRGFFNTIEFYDDDIIINVKSHRKSYSKSDIKNISITGDPNKPLKKEYRITVDSSDEENKKTDIIIIDYSENIRIKLKNFMHN